VHLDVKKLGRISQGGGHRALGRGPGRCVKGAGWEFVHVAIDDHSRLAYAEICPDEQAQTTVAFVGRALEFFEGAGIEVRRILTDNGSNYRSHLFCNHLLDRGIKVIKTRPYHPRPTARPRPSSRSSRTSGPTRSPTEATRNGPKISARS